MSLTLESRDEQLLTEGRFGRVLRELFEAIADDGRIDEEERKRIFAAVAELIKPRIAPAFEKATDFIVDILHRDADELRGAAERKREKMVEVQEEIDALRADADMNPKRRARKIRRRLVELEDLEEDAEDLDNRADQLEAEEFEADSE